MNVTDYDNMTHDYNDTLSIIKNFTSSENKIDIFIPTLLPCGIHYIHYTLYQHNNTMRSIIFLFDEFDCIHNN